MRSGRMVRFLLFVFLLLGGGVTQAGHSAPKASQNKVKRTVDPPLSIVGSETVYPYAAAVAERFAAYSDQPTPTIQATGTGAGIKLFCRGTGPHTPDILMASRPLKQTDYKLCNSNGVDPNDILEITIGYDGILFVQSLDARPLSLTLRDLFRALSAGEKVAPMTWQDISKTLPKSPIQILGPSSFSSTYERIREEVMAPFCHNQSPTCKAFRLGKIYRETSMSQNILLEKILKSRHLIGVVSFGFLLQNKNRLRGIPLNGVSPTFLNLFKRKYPLLNPLYIYLKKKHLHITPTILAYASEFFKPEASGLWGYLPAKGFIPLAFDEQQVVEKRLLTLKGIASAAQ